MSNPKSLTRRNFLKKSTTTAAALGAGSFVFPRTAKSADAVAGANERLNIGLIGCGGMGGSNIRRVMKEPNVKVTSLCDIAEFRLNDTAKFVEERQDDKPKTIFGKFDPMLDDKGVDGVFICTPDLWHFAPFMAAIDAGKHVYQQKPMSFTIEQGMQMVAKAKSRPKQTVQIGTQRRSNLHYYKARDMIKDGTLGDICFVRCWDTRNWSRNDPFAPHPYEGKIDWERFELPCKTKHKFDPWRYFAWRWYWDYAGGLVTDVGVHVLDIVHLLTGKTMPKSVVANGGVYLLKYWETPDVVNAVWDYGDYAVTFTGNFTNGKQGDGFAIYGTDATLYEVNADGDKYGAKRGDVVIERDRGDDRLIAVIKHEAPESHEGNWIRCIREGATPNAPVELGFSSELPLLLANLSYRAGKRLGWDPEQQKVTGL
jgi:predicted dehydrogenase